MSFVHISHVLEAAPPTPACFPDRLMWSEYLLSVERLKDAAHPFDKNGVYRPMFNFCRCCTQQHEAQMSLAGKCNPRKFFSELLNKELA